MTDEAQAIYQLLREIYVLREEVDQHVLQHLGLTVAQSQALSALATHGACSITRLGQLLLCDKSNATRLVDRLERAGWVAREPDPADLRGVRVCLTTQGERVCVEAAAAHQARVTERHAALSAAERVQLIALLGRVRDTLRAQQAAGGAPHAELHQLLALDVAVSDPTN